MKKWFVVLFVVLGLGGCASELTPQPSAVNQPPPAIEAKSQPVSLETPESAVANDIRVDPPEGEAIDEEYPDGNAPEEAYRRDAEPASEGIGVKSVLCATKWARVVVGLIYAQTDDMARLSYHELTFRTDGTYDCEGWHLGINFKKTGTFEVNGNKILMHDKKMLWQRDEQGRKLPEGTGEGVAPLIFRTNMEAVLSTEKHTNILKNNNMGELGWEFYSNVRYNWQKHRVEDGQGNWLKPPND